MNQGKKLNVDVSLYYMLITVLCCKTENKTMLFYTQPVGILVVLLRIVYTTIPKKFSA